jgi:LPXTG-site transpeptidase (sortase) family protein
MSEEPVRARAKIPGLQSIKRFYARSSPRRRLLLASGLLTFAAGLVLLGVGIASLGESQAEPPPAAALVDITPSPTPEPRTPTPVPTATPIPAPPLGDQPYRMIISKLGVDAPVSAFGLDANAVPEVPTGPEAPKIVAWYNFSSKPGIGSNAVFAGHVTWNGPAVFYNLTALAAGDEVKLVGDGGSEIVYRVTEVYSVDPNDPEAVSVMYATPDDVITIITCDPASTYTDTNDPVFGGEYERRVVVRASLATVNTAAVAPQPATGG